MVMAVVDSGGSVACTMGEEPEDIMAMTASGIEFNGQTASTIMDYPPMPDFGDCVMWTSMTMGTSTSCVPAIIPTFQTGVIGISWNFMPANGDEDFAICAIGGELSIEEPGTEIEIS